MCRLSFAEGWLFATAAAAATAAAGESAATAAATALAIVIEPHSWLGRKNKTESRYCRECALSTVTGHIQGRFVILITQARPLLFL